MAKLNIAVPHTREGALDQHLFGMFCEREKVSPSGSRSYEHIPVQTLRYDRVLKQPITLDGERVTVPESAG